MSGFQQQVNNMPAFGVSGDFASANPRASAIGGPGYFVAPASGIQVGAFAWVANNSTVGGPGLLSQPSASAPAFTAPQVFIGRSGQMSVWYNLLQQSGMSIPEGYPVTAYEAGDFWMGGSTTAASGGQKIYASTISPGVIATAASGSNPSGASFTAAIAATTGVLTVSAMASGTIVPGMQVTGAGVPANTFIQSQLSGTTGGDGTYQTNTTTAVASESLTGSQFAETKWYVAAGFSCNSGELVKASTYGP